jgi:phosphoglucosamine mutase
MKYFGTDGIRDRVKGPLLEPLFVFHLGKAVGQWMQRTPAPASRHVAIGRDTRASAGYLFLALARGLHSEGVRIFDAGICPTPAVATAVANLGLDMGIVITASHNPATDNGIKLFGPGGFKLTEAQELEIEAILDSLPDREEEDYSVTPPVRYYEARRHYVEGLTDILPDNSLMGYRIVVDCANGATFRTTRELLTRLGAQVIAIGCEPNGTISTPELAASIPIKWPASLSKTGGSRDRARWGWRPGHPLG